MMKQVMPGVFALCMLVATGCVTKGTHSETLVELDDARKSLAQTGQALDSAKKQAVAEAEDHKKRSAAEREGLQHEIDRLAGDLRAAQTDTESTKEALRGTKQSLDSEREAGKNLSEQLARMQQDRDRLQEGHAAVSQERDQFQGKTADLQRRLDTVQQDVASGRQALAGSNDRIAILEKEKEQLSASLANTRNEARDLAMRLAAEQSTASGLREDKQRLMSGTTTAQDELGKLQKRNGELETEAARAADLAKQLSERDQEIGRLRQASADRETLAGKLAAASDELARTKQRVASLTGELDALGSEGASLKHERDQIAADLRAQQDATKANEPVLARLTATVSERDQELEKLRQDHSRLQEQVNDRDARIKAEEAEKTRLEQERLAKEAEIQRLTQTHDDLAKSLKDEIAKGNVRIKQVRDQLTINMVDRVLFDSGQAQVKPEGLKVLKQVSDVLKHVEDKQIRIEGHTDHVPIGTKLRQRFPTNWELSTARATSVIRYLIEEGGVDRANISAGGYADTRPGASNETEDGRASNRRIEIVLYPKDLTEIASHITP